MSDLGYLTEIPGKWLSWFAWRPVKTIDNQLVWLRTIQRKTTVLVAGSQHTNTFSFSTKEYKVK